MNLTDQFNNENVVTPRQSDAPKKYENRRYHSK